LHSFTTLGADSIFRVLKKIILAVSLKHSSFWPSAVVKPCQMILAMCVCSFYVYTTIAMGETR